MRIVITDMPSDDAFETLKKVSKIIDRIVFDAKLSQRPIEFRVTNFSKKEQDLLAANGIKVRVYEE